MANKETTRVSAHVDRVLDASVVPSAGAGALGSGFFLAGAGALVFLAGAGALVFLAGAGAAAAGAGAGVAGAGAGVAGVGAEVGHVTAEPSAKTPESPHVYVVVALAPPTVAA